VESPGKLPKENPIQKEIVNAITKGRNKTGVKKREPLSGEEKKYGGKKNNCGERCGRFIRVTGTSQRQGRWDVTRKIPKEETQKAPD